jgi:hypothetical protein
VQAAARAFTDEKREGAPPTVADLRRAVAEAMTESVLAELRCLYDGATKERDAALMKDYAFMEGVESLEQLRAAVQTSRYWGDELALPVLERATGLHAVVVLSDGARSSVAARLDAPGHGSRTNVIFVRLRDQHYELLEFDGQVVFSSASLRAPSKPRRDSEAGSASEA